MTGAALVSALQDAATNIQSHYRGLLLRRREVKRHEDAQRKQKHEARARKKAEEQRRALVATYLQQRWRRNRPKQQQILRQLSAFVEHDKALLRKPLRVCVEAKDTHDLHMPWGGRLLLYGDLDAVHSLQVLHRPPRDAFYRAFAAMRKGMHDASVVGMAFPRWFTEKVLEDAAANALIERQRQAIALQRNGKVAQVAEADPSESPEHGEEHVQRAHDSALAALTMGEALPLVQVVGVEVHNYSEVRLKLSLAEAWLPSASASGRELILQAHSSAAMLVWLELLKVRRARPHAPAFVQPSRRPERPAPLTAATLYSRALAIASHRLVSAASGRWRMMLCRRAGTLCGLSHGRSNARRRRPQQVQQARHRARRSRVRHARLAARRLPTPTPLGCARTTTRLRLRSLLACL